MSIESIGQFLPIGWDEEELGVIAETQLGKMLNSSKQTGSAKMPYLRNINLQWGRISLSDIKEMDIFDEEKEQFTLQKGDVLVCEGGEPGRSAVWNIDLPMAFQNAVHRIRPSSKINSEFLCYQFEWLVKNGFLDENFSGVTIKHFSQQKLRRIKCVIPPIQEQGKIVELLEGQFSRLDSALASIRAVRKKSERFRRSLLHAAFTGVLTGHDISDGTLPEGWQLSFLGDVAKWGSGGTPKSGTSSYYGGPIKWSVIGDLTESWVTETAQTITNLGLEKSSAKLISPGTVMLAMYGASIGRTGIAAVEMATNQAIAYAVPHDGVLVAQYLLKYLQSQKDDFVRAGQGGAQPNISQTVIKPWPIPLPPTDEQMKIVKILEEQLSRLEASLAIADAIEKKASALRRSLLHAAFSGNLTKEWREAAYV
jgi:type I restriction enzyme S subunit